MMRTPRQNKSEKILNDELSYANNGLFAPAKQGTSFAANREELVISSALKSLDTKAKILLDAHLEDSQGVRP
jgi:hypothetical protein